MRCCANARYEGDQRFCFKGVLCVYMFINIGIERNICATP